MTINIKQAPFYPGMISPEAQDLVRQSELWPIVLALHFNTGGKIFVSEVVHPSHRLNKIHFRLKNGTSVLGIIRLQSEEIAIHFADSLLTSMLRKKDIIFSNNPRYIVNKLKTDEDLMSRILTQIVHLENRLVPEVLNGFTGYFSQEIKEPNTSIDVGMSNEVQEYAVRALFEGDKLVTNLEHVRVLQEWSKKLHDSDLKKERYNKKYAEMFSPAKHVLINISTGVFITGTVKNVCRSSDYRVTCEISEDFVMIPDINLNPELMASLAFWKILRESRKDQKIVCVDSQNMLPNTALIDLEAGSMVANSSMRILLVHKTGQQ